ncbi:hypothetical protein [Polymorphobacter sp.]|uniref:hypothetical protein n=1 Tax=Polymorphobacter sp. TaxID=1909290 RepID=UPI003F6FAFCC
MTMIYKDQTIALILSTTADPERAGFADSGLSLAGMRIQSVAIAALNIFHGEDSEVRLRFVTSNDDRSERDLLRNLNVEDAGVTLICADPAVVRTTLRLRTSLLLDNQRGGAEAVHRQLACATWLAAGRQVDASLLGDLGNRREKHLAMAAAILLDELVDRRITPLGACRFELAAELLQESAAEAGFDALAGRIVELRLAALQR